MEREVIQTLNSLLTFTGSTWVSKDTLLDACNKKGLKDPDADIKRLLERKVLYRYEDLVTLKAIGDAETEIAQNCFRLLAADHKVYSEDFLSRLIDNALIEFGFDRLASQQREAVKKACNNMLFVLTGGPGTGKTTVLKVIAYCLRAIADLEKARMAIVYAAPTGKAARRIAESTGENARTLHKEMGLTFAKTTPDYFSRDVLFADECSMLDNDLAAKLFKAVSTGRRLFLVGDVDQLPSVGIGAVLRDLIKSGVIPVTMLTETFRQVNGSGLMTGIDAVRDGKMDFPEADDFHAIEINEDKATEEILRTYKSSVEKWGAENVVVLTPYRKKTVCSNILNNYLQRIVNKEKTGWKYTDSTGHTQFFMVGDFVMQLTNREECANGEVGIVKSVSEQGVSVLFEGFSVLYSPADIKQEQLSLAYAMTVNKSQGSEYKCVITMLFNCHKMMFNKNIVYTAITRAKKECFLFYEKNAMETALVTKADASRKTLLCEKLIALHNKNCLLQAAS